MYWAENIFPSPIGTEKNTGHRQKRQKRAEQGVRALSSGIYEVNEQRRREVQRRNAKVMVILDLDGGVPGKGLRQIYIKTPL